MSKQVVLAVYIVLAAHIPECRVWKYWCCMLEKAGSNAFNAHYIAGGNGENSSSPDIRQSTNI